nr:hypothetical protein [Tanacetum cinerariifolium]
MAGYSFSKSNETSGSDGTSKLVEDTEDESLNSDTKRKGLEDGDPGSEEEEAAPEGEGSMPSTFKIGQSSRSVREQQRPPSPEWSFSSLPVSPSSPIVPIPVVSPVTTQQPL